MPLQLSTPVKFVKRIGERIAAGLAERGIATIEDLLYHLPFRYEDRLHPKPLSLYSPGDMASLIGEVRGTALLRTRSGPIFEMTIGVTPPDEMRDTGFDPAASQPATSGGPGPASGTWVSTDTSMAGLLGSGPRPSRISPLAPRPSHLASRPSHLAPPLETVKCMWFHGTYLKDKFHAGQKIALYGKLEGSRSGNALGAVPGSTRFKMIQPTFEILPDTNPGSPTSALARGGGNAIEEDAEFILLEMGRIVPVYESLGGKTPWGSKLTSRWTRRILWTIFKDLTESSALYNPAISTEPSASHPNPVISTEAKRSGETPVFRSQPLSPQPLPGDPGAPGPASGTRVSSASSAAPLANTTTQSPSPSAQDETLPTSPESSASHKTVISTEAKRSGETPVFRSQTLSPQPIPGDPGAPGPASGTRVSSASSAAPLANTTTQSPSLSAQDETLPTSLRTRLNFPTRMAALRDLHFPPAGTAMTELMSARTPAHRRLIFEEFFYLELGLELKRRKLRTRPGTAFVTNDEVREALKQILPFKPTAAQKRVLGEIVHDMRRPQPMRRLLQGDVGSGKTIVAFQAALVAIENGYQVALMAPTEILATQHYLSARKLLSEKISPRTKRPYRIALLTGSLDDKTKRDTRARIFRGEVDLAIGTHALVEDKVDFANLGLVIVDEQHRFGVQQRFRLSRKPNSGVSQATQTLSSRPERAARSGETPVFRSNQHDPSGAPSVTMASSSARVGMNKSNTTMQSPSPSAQDRSPSLDAQSDPDVLVMTATPIPRTLALTLYGDLEASVIDELPPGRTPIQTRRMPEERSDEVWDFVRKQVTAGRQAYIVYPIIEGANDDQPELDFAKFDDPASSSDSPSRPKPTTHKLSSRPEARSAAVERPAAPDRATTKSRAKTAPLKAPRQRNARTTLRSATDMHQALQQGPLHGLRLGLLHGRMSADDKEVTMARFKRNELDVLVSTTVIEVGVDVPNATVMVIEHADRFGLAQLHQLRGRVGRGAAKSFCILVTNSQITPEADLRLNAMVQTQDGFALAELDLQQRGPGEFFGTKQAGLPEFRVANLARDRDLLELARQEAARFVEQQDPTMPRPEIDAVWSRLKQQWQRRYGLVEA